MARKKQPHGLRPTAERKLRLYSTQTLLSAKDTACLLYTSIHYDQEILFYTLRDVNALKRSRTFITERIANAIDVDPQKLAYYCYIDCFKKYANAPYYLGNFDIPFIKEEFSSVSKSVTKIAKHNHPEVFGNNDAPTDAEIDSVIKYINKVTSLSL